MECRSIYVLLKLQLLDRPSSRPTKGIQGSMKTCYTPLTMLQISECIVKEMDTRPREIQTSDTTSALAEQSKTSGTPRYCHCAPLGSRHST